jgi:ParB family transcriptional regulator, chromosome partitioning protein
MARLRDALAHAAQGGTYEADPTAASMLRLTLIPTDRIVPDPDQPRKDLGNLDDLTASIRTHGVLEPILVREIERGRFRIVAGERRHSAARRAGLTSVPAIVRDDLAADARFEVQLVENLHRKDLNAIETAMAYRILLEEHGYSQRRLAERLGRSVSGINETLRLLSLPADVVEGVLTSEHSGNRSLLLEIAKLPDEASRRAAWATAREGHLTVRSARERKAPAETRIRTVRKTFRTRTGSVTVELPEGAGADDLAAALREALEAASRL